MHDGDASARLAKLVEAIGRFYVTDRRMRRAQKTMTQALARGTPPPKAVAAYIAAVSRYFTGFEREARAHLTDLDRRLARINQLHFNLTAERGVATHRVEATQGVLSQIRELARK